MKVCRKCGAERPLEDFPKENRRPDGRNSQCRVCVNARARENHAKRMADPVAREKRKERRRAYDVAHREGRNEWMLRWRAANPEKSRKKRAEARAKLLRDNPDYFRQWYWKNVETERIRAKLTMRRSRADNPGAERERKQRYRANNLGAVRAREREKTYARRAKQSCSPELAELMELIRTESCVYCGAEGPGTIDHIVPLSRGGKHEADNLAPACFSCNSSKGSRLLSEWNGRAT